MLDHDAWLCDIEEFDQVPCPCCRGRGCPSCRHTGHVYPEAAEALRERLATDDEFKDR